MAMRSPSRSQVRHLDCMAQLSIQASTITVRGNRGQVTNSRLYGRHAAILVDPLDHRKSQVRRTAQRVTRARGAYGVRAVPGTWVRDPRSRVPCGARLCFARFASVRRALLQMLDLDEDQHSPQASRSRSLLREERACPAHRIRARTCERDR